MSLVCALDYDCEHSWFYVQPEDYVFLKTKKRCSSCKTKINTGELALPFKRFRPAKDWVEEKIYGDASDAVTLATWYMCEKCGDTAMNLDAIGYCTPPDSDMRKLLAEYVNMVANKNV